jgi:phosphoglucosamine mutase
MRVPQQTINVRIDAGSKPLDSVAVREAAALAEERLRGRGRLVLRPSGTEPVVRITVEADEQALLDSVLSSLSAAVHAAA